MRLDPLGIVAALGAGLSYAALRRCHQGLDRAGWDSTEALAAQFTLGALVLLPVVLTEPLGWVGTVSGVVMLAHLGIVTVGVAYWLYGIGLRTLPTSTVVLLTLAEPVTAAVLAVVVLDEQLSPLGWIGAAIVGAGLVIGAREQHSPTAVPEA